MRGNTPRWPAAPVLSAVHTEAATRKDVLVMGKNIGDMIAMGPAQAYEFSDNEFDGNICCKLLTTQDTKFSFHHIVRLNKTPAFIIMQSGFSKNNVEKLIRATDDHTLVMTLRGLCRCGRRALNATAPHHHHSTATMRRH